MIKKIFCLSVILSLSLVIFGCGGGASGLLGGITGTALPAGVTITIGTTSTTATSASDGSYSFSNINAGAVTLNFTKTGYASQTKTVTVTAGATANVAAVTLSSIYGGVAGTVELSGETDHSGISISISVNGYSGTATTNSSGAYSFSNLSPGTVTLNFSKSGYDSVTTVNTVTAAATTNISTVTLNITKGSVTGKATLSGTAAADISVTLNGTSTTTDSNGNFTFSNVIPGTYTLTYGKNGYTSQTQQVTVTAGQATDAGTVNLPSTTGTVSGKVVLYGESDHSDADVELNGTTVQTDSNGNYSFTNVTPGTYTTMTISKTGFVSGSTTNVVVAADTATSVGDITIYRWYAVVASYNISSILSSATPLAMTCSGNFLYISTNTPEVFEITKSDPTASSPTSIEVTHNYVSMLRATDNISCFAQSGNDMIVFSYNLPSLSQIFDITTLPGQTVFACAAFYSNYVHLAYYDSSAFYDMDTSGGVPTTNITDVSETGIIGLDTNDLSLFFACNTTHIYEYSSDFSSVKSQTASTVGISSNLVAIAYDGTNIWTIDDNGILYKHLDNY